MSGTELLCKNSNYMHGLNFSNTVFPNVLWHCWQRQEQHLWKVSTDTRLTAFCPSTRKVKSIWIWIYWSKRQWVGGGSQVTRTETVQWISLKSLQLLVCSDHVSISHSMMMMMMILFVWQPIGWISLQTMQSNAHTKITKITNPTHYHFPAHMKLAADWGQCFAFPIVFWQSQPFYSSLDFVRDNPDDELVPESTFLDFLVQLQNEHNTSRCNNSLDGLPPHQD